ncbi:hypothetical protein [Streptomyces sp. NPDC001250]|uniref:hypothetical protein n=1 Tax=unclassified Streptomyces TaxID=2593676 RepID=UPI003318B901
MRRRERRYAGHTPYTPSPPCRFRGIDSTAARRAIRRTERVLRATAPAPVSPSEPTDQPFALCPSPNPTAP